MFWSHCVLVSVIETLHKCAASFFVARISSLLLLVLLVLPLFAHSSHQPCPATPTTPVTPATPVTAHTAHTSHTSHTRPVLYAPSAHRLPAYNCNHPHLHWPVQLPHKRGEPGPLRHTGVHLCVAQGYCTVLTSVVVVRSLTDNEPDHQRI